MLLQAQAKLSEKGKPEQMLTLEKPVCVCTDNKRHKGTLPNDCFLLVFALTFASGLKVSSLAGTVKRFNSGMVFSIIMLSKLCTW